MAKFIEVNQQCSVLRIVQGEEVRECVKEPIIINADRILTIIPQGDSCIITLIGDVEGIHIAQSAMSVMSLINGQQ